tara:strand:- start:64 stop:825 length:762 start_codon:yes stop_codon:yes gene_type:complete
MFLNNTTCDLYMGTGAGKKLLKDIDNAKQSVKILSPFLSPSLVQKLIGLKHLGVNVQLITTDTIEDFYGDRKRNIHELIHQHIDIDHKAKTLRKRWKKIRVVMNSSATLLLGILIWLMFTFHSLKATWFLIPIATVVLIGQFLKTKIKKKRVFSYTYTQLFPFKVVMSRSTMPFGGLFLHGKTYIIDDKTAYLGSLNFTNNGTKNNYETRIRLTGTESVQMIVEEFDRLLNHDTLPEVCVQSWGSTLYPEPIN